MTPYDNKFNEKYVNHNPGKLEMLLTLTACE